MAAEIATALAVGASCPVCGSCDHPHPAASAPGAPTSAEEKAARKRGRHGGGDPEQHTRTAFAPLDTALAVARAHAGAADREAVEAELADGSIRSQPSRRSGRRSRRGHRGPRPGGHHAADNETELGAAKVELGSVATSIAGANEPVQRLLESLEDFPGRSSVTSRHAIHAREAAAALLAAALEAWRGPRRGRLPTSPKAE